MPNGEQVLVPWNEAVEAIATKAAETVVEKHISIIEQRVRKLEVNWAKLLGFIAASGASGGFIAGVVSNLF
jgi:hypothetical protein